MYHSLASRSQGPQNVPSLLGMQLKDTNPQLKVAVARSKFVSLVFISSILPNTAIEALVLGHLSKHD
jgi:hypothetical protein